MNKYFNFTYVPIIIWIFLSIINIDKLQSQENELEIDFLELNESIFKNSVEISGITKVGDTFYLPSEKHQIIYKVDAITFKLLETKDIDLSKKSFFHSRPKVEIEGITKFNNYLLLLDEYPSPSAMVYAYDLDMGTLFNIPITGCTLETIRIGKNTYGWEGIAFNNKLFFLYLIRERRKDNKVEIVVLSLNTDKQNKPNGLSFKETIVLPNQSNTSWRYTDLCLNNDNTKLFCLKSYYDKDNTINNRYHVQAINLDNEGLPKNLAEETITTERLSKLVIDQDNSYNYDSNLEGLFIDGDDYFIVSDNTYNGHGNTFEETLNRDSDGKTAFIKLSTKSGISKQAKNKPPATPTTQISLKEYCPTEVGQEGAICFAYATTYTALSIEHNILEGNTDESSPKFKSFSYGFVASQVKQNKSFWGKLFNRCGRNATAKLALEVLKKDGTVPYDKFTETCKCRKTDELAEDASKIKIQNYYTVGDINTSEESHIKSIKSCLLSRKPVITTIYQENFFGNNEGKEDVTFSDTYKKHHINANHVVCIVGFDDDRNGGSFLVKNNYEKWGKNGFSNVKYKDFIKLIRTSYIIEL